MKTLILLCILLLYTDSAHTQFVKDTSDSQKNETNNLYLIRFVGEDTENNINFYGVCFGGLHKNQTATFSGFTLNLSMGEALIDMPPLQIVYQ
jgi:hypothetical protein